MQNSKLIQILKTFSKEEMKEFDKFISSPFFGCRKFIIEFFRILKKYYPEFKDDHINKEKLFKEMYKDKKYNDGLMRRINSEIIKYAEEYLMFTRLYKTKVYRNNCLLMELRDRNLNNIFSQKSKVILNELDKRSEIDFYYLLDKHLTEIEIYNDFVQHNSKHTYEHMEKSLSSLILFFLNSYLSLSYNHKRFKRSHDDEVVTKFIESLNNDKFIKGLENVNSKELVLIKTIYYSNLITLENDITIYSKMKNIFEKNYEMFSPQQKMIFYARLFTFYAKYNYINDDRFLKDQFENYKRVLKEKLFLIFYPYMGILFGRNYVKVCRRFAVYDDILKFVNDFSQFFDPGYKEEFIHYCKSNYYVGKKNYGKSLEHSSKVNIELPPFRLDLKILKIICFYELNYFESFYSEIDTLKHFLRNAKELNKDLKLSATNFSMFVSKLTNLNERPGKSKIIILKKEIENEKHVSEKKWLLEKVN